MSTIFEVPVVTLRDMVVYPHGVQPLFIGTPKSIAALEAAPTAPDTSAAAARILEMAQQTADEYVSEARRTADGLVADAEKAARKSVKKLEHQRRDLEDRVTALRTFESEIRSRLTDYFQSQLSDLRALAEDEAEEEAKDDEAEGEG